MAKLVLPEHGRVEVRLAQVPRFSQKVATLRLYLSEVDGQGQAQLSKTCSKSAATAPQIETDLVPGDSELRLKLEEWDYSSSAIDTPSPQNLARQRITITAGEVLRIEVGGQVTQTRDVMEGGDP